MLPATFVLLVFPDGHLPSPRWRFVAWSAALGLAMIVLGVMFHPGPLGPGVWRQTPLGSPERRRSWICCLLSAVFLALGFLDPWQLCLRFRRSTGIEREQMKWLVYALGILLFPF